MRHAAVDAEVCAAGTSGTARLARTIRSTLGLRARKGSLAHRRAPTCALTTTSVDAAVVGVVFRPDRGAPLTYQDIASGGVVVETGGTGIAGHVDVA